MNRFSRDSKGFPYKKRFFFCLEGEKSEKSYLQIVFNRFSLTPFCNLVFACSDSNISHLRMEADKIEEKDFNSKYGDEIWILLDRDFECHPQNRLNELAQWEQAKIYRHSAISTPRFEYWLLLHFMEKPSVANAQSDTFVESKIKNFKAIPIGTPALNCKNIKEAIQRGKKSQFPALFQIL